MATSRSSIAASPGSARLGGSMASAIGSQGRADDSGIAISNNPSAWRVRSPSPRMQPPFLARLLPSVSKRVSRPQLVRSIG